MSKPCQVIVLVEDARHQAFVRRYLRRLGERKVRQIRLVDLPGSRGSGEQYVREHYAVEAKRCRSSHVTTALVVAIDADTQTVEERAEQLRLALTKAGEPVREAGERIAHLIPRRNIETWILCLRGRVVNEDEDYSGERNLDEHVKPAAEAFFAWSRPNATPPDHCVDSLRKAIPEVRRLE